MIMQKDGYYVLPTNLPFVFTEPKDCNTTITILDESNGIVIKYLGDVDFESPNVRVATQQEEQYWLNMQSSLYYPSDQFAMVSMCDF